MTAQGKNPNSIIVLATIGVYLGLLLAGAAPHTLGQAATSRQFDIKEETGQKDDLDKKPDDEKALEQFAAALEDLYRITTEITAEDPRRTSKRPLSFSYYVTVKPNGVARQYAPAHQDENAIAWSGRLREPLHKLYDAFLPRANDWDKNFLVDFSLGQDQVSLSATIVLDNASPFRSADLQNALWRRRAAAADFVRSQIYEATHLTVSKNKIIVVANLPRAGLASLLEKDGQ